MDPDPLSTRRDVWRKAWSNARAIDDCGEMANRKDKGCSLAPRQGNLARVMAQGVASTLRSGLLRRTGGEGCGSLQAQAPNMTAATTTQHHPTQTVFEGFAAAYTLGDSLFSRKGESHA